LEALSHWNYSFLPISIAIFVASKKLGPGINCILTPYVYEKSGSIMLMLYSGLGLAILCLASCILFAVVEKIAMHGNEQYIEKKHVNFSQISNFPRLFWLIIFYMAFYYAVINTLYTTASGMSQDRFGLSISTAGFLIVLFSNYLVHCSYSHYSTQPLLWILIRIHEQVHCSQYSIS
jgi:nitrate/nitrite transporter NarK